MRRSYGRPGNRQVMGFVELRIEAVCEFQSVGDDDVWFHTDFFEANAVNGTSATARQQ